MSSICPCSSHFFPKLSKLEHDRTGAFPEFYYVLPTRSKQFRMLLRDTVCRFQHSNLVSSRRICIHYLARFWDSLRNWLQASLGFGRCSGESFVHAECQHLTDTWAYNSVLTAWLDQCTSQFSRREWSQGGNVWQSWSQLENMANISIIPTPWNISNSVDIRRLTAGGFQDIPTFTESYRVHRVPRNPLGILGLRSILRLMARKDNDIRPRRRCRDRCSEVDILYIYCILTGKNVQNEYLRSSQAPLTKRIIVWNHLNWLFV